MPTAIDRTLAADVRAIILAAGLTVPVIGGPIPAASVVVDYLPRFEPADLVDLRILVAPRSRTLTPLSRASRRREIAIQIAVMQSAAPNSPEFLELVDLVAGIDEYLATANMVAGLNYTGQWLESSTALYDIAALEQHSIFRSVLTVTYAVLT